MATIPLPDTDFLKKTIRPSLTIKDLVYIAILSFMLMNQHFGTEARLTKLEDSFVQTNSLLQTMNLKIDKEMVPRKEHEASNIALSIRLGNIETAQNNIMTYLLNHGK